MPGSIKPAPPQQSSLKELWGKSKAKPVESEETMAVDMGQAPESAQQADRINTSRTESWKRKESPSESSSSSEFVTDRRAL